MDVQIRHLMWDDIPAIAALHRASEAVDHAGRVQNAATLRQRWCVPDSTVQEECLVAVIGGRGIVGYAIRSFVPNTDQCILDGVVHPAWRRRGIGRQLLAHSLEEARSAGARTLDWRARDDEPVAIAFCQAMGFRCERKWTRMWLQPLGGPSFPFPPGYGWRHFRPNHDEAAYAEIVTETFNGHWGTGPTSIERVTRMVSQPGFEPGNILFATCRHEIVGVCTTRFLEREVGRFSYATAHVGPVGVRAEHRGRGLARAMITACLQWCRRRRIAAAELDVDEQNAAAIHVYQDCGFQEQFNTFWYRKDLV